MTRQFVLTLEDDHRAECKEAAASEGLTLSAFIRQASLQAARAKAYPPTAAQPIKRTPPSAIPAYEQVQALIADIRARVADTIRNGPFTLEELEDYGDLDAALIRQFEQGFIHLDNDQLARLAKLVGPYRLGPDLEQVPGSVGGRGSTGEGARTRRKRLSSFRTVSLHATDPDLYEGAANCSPEELEKLQRAAVVVAEREYHPHPHLPNVVAIRRHAIIQRAEMGSRVFPALDEAHRRGWLVALDPRDVSERFGLTQTQGWLRFHVEGRK